MNFGFIKTAAATPKIKVADTEYNTVQILKMINEAVNKQTSLIAFPELCICGYTCSDLFYQKELLDSCEKCLEYIIEQTKTLDILCVIGVPVAFNSAIYNCAAVICHGKLLGLVPKVSIPNYNEFYESRQFAPGKGVNIDLVYASQKVRLSSSLVFTCESIPNFKFAVEICEDLWTPVSPSVFLATDGGATVIVNISASNEVIGKSQYRKDLVKIQSGKLYCGYVYCSSGVGESTTDCVYSGHSIIAENGTVLAESKKYKNSIIYTDIDVDKIICERRRTNTFCGDNLHEFEYIWFDLPVKQIELTRTFPKLPFVPGSKTDLDTRCDEIISMQSVGLSSRMEKTGISDLVIGISGGLDSTLALIVCIKALDMLKISHKNLHTITMPCFGTTSRTRSNAEKMAIAYGTDFCEVDITSAVRQHFKDISHDESLHNVTYENAQARERTQVLMDLANKYNALVVGTGDLSELALGWATYNGDQMSMYAVNASIPKTLVRYLVSFEASRSEEDLRNVLCDVLETPVSPELLPPDKNGEIAQKTESVVGPYELHDFFLYHFFRFGYTPKKIYYLACKSFENDYDKQTIKKWLFTFFSRFFSQQFKRSCMPDGPKVGTVALSPRGDLRMPSDASAKLWLDSINEL